MDVFTRVRGCADPLSYQAELWEVVVEGAPQRWYGPDSLLACLEAQRVLEPIARQVASTGELVRDV